MAARPLGSTSRTVLSSGLPLGGADHVGHRKALPGVGPNVCDFHARLLGEPVEVFKVVFVAVLDQHPLFLGELEGDTGQLDDLVGETDEVGLDAPGFLVVARVMPER